MQKKWPTPFRYHSVITLLFKLRLFAACFVFPLLFKEPQHGGRSKITAFWCLKHRDLVPYLPSEEWFKARHNTRALFQKCYTLNLNYFSTNEITEHSNWTLKFSQQCLQSRTLCATSRFGNSQKSDRPIHYIHPKNVLLSSEILKISINRYQHVIVIL